MSERPFQQVDVFGASTLAGNPLAVVLDGSGLDDEHMQRFARWTNLSETTFVLPPTDPQADYRLRIFTPGGELPFAGHPTLGTCHAWLATGGRPRDAERIVQQSKAGLVPIRREHDRLAFAAPLLRRSAPMTSQLSRVAAALGLKAQQVRAAQLLDNGPVWLGLLLEDVDTVLGLKPDHQALKAMGVKVGVAALTAEGVSQSADADAGKGEDEDSHPYAPALIGRSNREARAFAREPLHAVALEVRAFAAPIGVEEDPVTGSLNASLAQWLIADGHLPERYLAAQGQCLGHAGRVHVQRDAQGEVWIGGRSVTLVSGTVDL